MDLSVAEKLLLLCQSPDKNGLSVPGFHLPYGIIASLMTDLAYSGHISEKERKVVIVNKNPDKASVLSDITETIRESQKRRSMKSWVQRLAMSSGRFRRAIQDELERKGLLRIERKKFLGIISYRKTWLRGHKTQKSLVNTLAGAVRHPDLALPPSDLRLLGIVLVCQLHETLGLDSAKDQESLDSATYRILSEDSTMRSLAQIINETDMATGQIPSTVNQAAFYQLNSSS
ncbi:GOLPH3/VPS74 family protein [Fulvitalea axinellae]